MVQRYDPIHDVLVDTGDEKHTKEEAKIDSEHQNGSVETVANKEDTNEESQDNKEPLKESTDGNSTGDVHNDASQDTEEEVIEPEQELETTESTSNSTPTVATTTTSASTKPIESASTSSNTPNKKHKLSPSPTKTPLKKFKKHQHKSATVLSSARSRHLKKDDGRPFLRKDIQFQFLKDLFEDDTKAFIDPYEDSKDRVVTEPYSPHKLTFAELYIKTIAHSSKCSKILRDRLLNDMNMSIPTSMICLLVNVGRMNTTINFVPDMKSQLRTYHSIPCLQVDYDASENKFNSTGNGGDKQLQDTPRLKSILKACCDDTDEPNALNLLNGVDKFPKTNVINMIFLLCNAEDTINKSYLEESGYGFFDIFMNSEFDPKERVKLFLWLIFAYLETDLSSLQQREKNPFGLEIPILNKTDKEYDVDTPEEVEFGNRLYEQRVKFLAEDSTEAGDEQTKKHDKVDKKDKKDHTPAKQNNKLDKTPAKQQQTKPKVELHQDSNIQQHQKQNTPQHNIHLRLQPQQELTTQQSHQQKQTTVQHHSKRTFQFPVLPKNDIDTDSVRKSLKYLGRISGKKRTKLGQLKFEHKKIEEEEKAENSEPILPSSAGGATNNRIRLKDYKGDYAENSDKFNTLFNFLKNDFVEMVKADTISEAVITSEYQDINKDLTLSKFSIDL
ncbi:Ino eighty subunit 1 [Wickerhamomyces ciferrii]|uniref:Ino eighty subunit 1 n=1 Tax=Wickerhamomyces ciferrii (strain ATCC 14091 / BCRC 22168 / CBS 111 / JCM 3599 / NBRC 0793 / NRRL Y-1031 F-60-10) TaxID=1206466 RepID=K0KRE0_WICCF|nr:Ino eighty subunit 1 [Wickerhamomyces ciferrii]CCH43878.1 Ino eighty subunit 1 [Wickerhamomyces ciferrii]